MPTHITQIDDDDDGVTILRIEGDMLQSDAELIERIARQLHDSTGTAVTIDLADLDFIDSEAASVLKRIEGSGGLEIVGMEIFLQNAVNKAEKR